MTGRDVTRTIWKCHPRTLKRAFKRGYINAKLVGKVYWYDTASILAWLSSASPSAVPAQAKRGRGRPRKVVAAK
jgi:hypothetical protein